VLETRQRIRFRPAVQSKSGFLMSETRDRGAFALQVNGPNVVFLHATPPSRVSELADELWKDIEIDPELKVIPFESARTGNQLSFSRR
jgi:hypothetical protein